MTAQCAQLDQANRAWQQYHQTQLENFRKQLQDWILFDENDTLEQIGQRIILQLDQLGSSKESDDQTGEIISKDSSKEYSRPCRYQCYNRISQ